MSPWTCIGWLILAFLYIASAGGLWFLARLLHWPAWIAPAFGFGAAPLALVFALIRRLLSSTPREETPAPPPAPLISAKPEMIDFLPPKEVSRHWHDLLAPLGTARRPVFLALGEDDATRAGLWRESPHCQCYRDDLSGLAFVSFPDALWVDVPARFAAPPETNDSQPSPTGGPSGLWEELASFLPRLPGNLSGVLLLVDPIPAPSGTDAALAWLAGKLDFLYARCATTPPLWIAATRLEGIPGGGRLIRTLSTGDASARMLLSRPLGMSADGPAAAHTIQSGIDRLAAELDGFLLGCDSAARDSALSRSVYLVQKHLSRHTANALALAARLSATTHTRKAPLSGLFLTGNNPITNGLAFTGDLTRTIIPHRTPQPPRRRGILVPALLWLAVLAAGATAFHLHKTAVREIQAIPFDLLDASPGGGAFAGPPPIARYALARERLAAIKNSHSLTKKAFPALPHHIHRAETLFTANLRTWLPETNDPAATARWLDGMTEWTTAHPDAAPIPVYNSAEETLTIPAAFTAAGRNRVAALLSDWRALLPEEDARTVDALLAGYDARLLSAWRKSGKRILAVLDKAVRSPDFQKRESALNDSPSLSFLQTAARELSFPTRIKSPWRASVLAINAAATASAARNGDIEITRIGDAGRTLRSAIQRNPSLKQMDYLLAAAERWQAYRAAIAALQPSRASENGLTSMAAILFDPPVPLPEASLQSLANAWKTLHAALARLEPLCRSKEGEEALFLAAMPFRLHLLASVFSAAETLQKEWSKSVHLPLADLSPEDATLQLLQDNAVETFITGAAAPYLTADRPTLSPATALGQSIPFTPDFLDWVSESRRRIRLLSREYPVTITIRPATVNKTAAVFPRGASFSLSSPEVSATGYNYPVTESFVWSFPTGGDASASVNFDTFTLPLHFSGRLGLIKLIQSLNNNRLELPLSSFPSHARFLSDNCVTSVTMHMDVDASGAERLPPLLSPVPATIMTDPPR